MKKYEGYLTGISSRAIYYSRGPQGSLLIAAFSRRKYNKDMNILIVEDEPILLDGMVEVVRHCEPDAEIAACASGEEALEAASRTNYDVAFLDIEMPDMNGVSLARKLKDLAPGLNLIFATAHPQYTGRAMDMHASGYILKPVTEEKVRRELEDLRHPVGNNSLLGIQAFGNFEVFYKSKPLRFRYSKTKEMLAYLVDRKGALVSGKEIQAVLWEESGEDKSSYYKQLRKDLFDTLREAGCEDALVGVRGALAVVPRSVICDYFMWLQKKPGSEDLYRGEYMQQYSWAEETHGSLEMLDDL